MFQQVGTWNMNTCPFVKVEGVADDVFCGYTAVALQCHRRDFAGLQRSVRGVNITWFGANGGGPAGGGTAAGHFTSARVTG